MSKTDVLSACDLTTDCERVDVNRLLPLERHAWALAEYARDASTYLGDDRWLRCGDWLTMAAGLEEVVVDPARFDSAAMLCSMAVPYELARQRDTAAWALDLSRFLFAWNAFESLVAAACPPTALRRGLVHGAAALLDRRASDLRHLNCTLGTVVILAERHPDYAALAREARRTPQATAAMRVAAKVRNRYVHGGLGIPAPDQWGDEASYTRGLTRPATRLSLFSVQQLLAVLLDIDALDRERDEDEDRWSEVAVCHFAANGG